MYNIKRISKVCNSNSSQKCFLCDFIESRPPIFRVQIRCNNNISSRKRTTTAFIFNRAFVLITPLEHMRDTNLTTEFINKYIFLLTVTIPKLGSRLLIIIVLTQLLNSSMCLSTSGYTIKHTNSNIRSWQRYHTIFPNSDQ